MIELAPIVFADVENLIKIVLVILFIVVPAVLQLLNKGRNQKKPAPPQRRPAPGPQRPAGDKPAVGELEDEIGAFLRRAVERRGGRQRPVKRPAGEPVVAEVVGRRPLSVEAVAEIPLGEEVRQHTLDTGEFARRAATLGGEVAQADANIDDRLHQVFDHDVSSLAGKPGESALPPQALSPTEPEDHVTELPATAAAGLAALFANAQSVRQAVIINEILPRPEHRWT